MNISITSNSSAVVIDLPFQYNKETSDGRVLLDPYTNKDNVMNFESDGSNYEKHAYVLYINDLPDSQIEVYDISTRITIYPANLSADADDPNARAYAVNLGYTTPEAFTDLWYATTYFGDGRLGIWHHTPLYNFQQLYPLRFQLLESDCCNCEDINSFNKLLRLMFLETMFREAIEGERIDDAYKFFMDIKRLVRRCGMDDTALCFGPRVTFLCSPCKGCSGKSCSIC